MPRTTPHPEHDPPAASVEELLEEAAESEDRLLALLSRRRLPARFLEKVARESPFQESLKVRTALARHPSAPLHVALPQLKYVSTMNLVAMLKDHRLPSVIRKKVEGALLERLPKQPLGIKKAVARLGRGGLLVRLLEEEAEEIVVTCLSNPQLTESDLSTALFRPATSTTTVRLLTSHPKWSRRYGLRLALLRNPRAPLADCLRFAPSLKLADLRTAARDSRVHPSLRIHLDRILEKRGKDRAPDAQPGRENDGDQRKQ